MEEGGGKYGPEFAAFAAATGVTGAILVVIEGPRGPSLSVRGNALFQVSAPDQLRVIADAMDASIREMMAAGGPAKGREH